LFDGNGNYSIPTAGYYSVGYLVEGEITATEAGIYQIVNGDQKYYNFNSNGTKGSLADDGYYSFGHLVSGSLVFPGGGSSVIAQINKGNINVGSWYSYRAGYTPSPITGIHRFKNTSGVYSSVLDVAGDNWYVFDTNGAATAATGIIDYTGGKLYNFGTNLNSNVPTLLQGVLTYNGRYVNFGSNGLDYTDADSNNYNIYDTYQVWDNVEGHQIGVSGGKYYYFNRDGSSATLITGVWADTAVSDWSYESDYQITARIDGTLKDYGVNGTASPSLASVGLHKVNYVYTSDEIGNDPHGPDMNRLYHINGYVYGYYGRGGYPLEQVYVINIPSTGASMSASLGMSTGAATYYTGTALNLEGDSKYHYYIDGADQGLVSGNYKRGLTSTVYTYASGVEGSTYTGINYYVAVNGVNTYYSVTAGTVGAALNGYYSLGYYVDGVKTALAFSEYHQIVDGNQRYMSFDSVGNAFEINGYYSFGYMVNGVKTGTTPGVNITIDTSQNYYFNSAGDAFALPNGYSIYNANLYLDGVAVDVTMALSGSYAVTPSYNMNTIIPDNVDNFVYFTTYFNNDGNEIYEIHPITDGLSTYLVYVLSFTGLTTQQKDSFNDILAASANMSGPGDGVIGRDGIIYVAGVATANSLTPTLTSGIYTYGSGLKYTGILNVSGVYKYVHKGTLLTALVNGAVRLPSDSFKYHYFIDGVDQGLVTGTFKCPEFGNYYRTFSLGDMISDDYSYIVV
jgi:hypothetical protein